jgi:hypothetical protein
MLVALTLVWGTNWPLFPHAVREVSVWTFRSIAMVGSGLLLLALARLRGQPLVHCRAGTGAPCCWAPSSTWSSGTWPAPMPPC